MRPTRLSHARIAQRCKERRTKRGVRPPNKSMYLRLESHRKWQNIRRRSTRSDEKAPWPVVRFPEATQIDS